MTKTIFLTLAISLLASSLGFTSCKESTKSVTVNADSLNLSPDSIILPDTAANRIAMADSSWETAAKTFSADPQPVEDTTNASGRNLKIEKRGKPKISPLGVGDPYRPQELKDGLAKARNGDLRGAIADFDICIEKNYKNYNAYFYKAKALIELNEPQNALPNLNKAIEYNQSNAMFFYYRGKLLFDTGNTNDAITDFEKAIALKPDFVDALNYRGVIKEVRGMHKEAIEDFDAAIKANPDFATAYYNKGTSEAALELYSDAIVSFSKCVELDAKKTMGYMNRGNCYVMIKDYKSAIGDYSTVISLEPKNSDAYYNRGAAYQFTGDKNACNDWRKAQSLGNKKAAEVLKNYCK